jgi:prolyl-tRNA synthetase
LIQAVPGMLEAIQQGLFDRALALREEHSCEIDNEADFRAYFTPQNPDQPELHGGFAYCHFADERDLEELLKELKVTVRCVPQADNEQAGTCFLTGKPAAKRAIFAKAY